MKTVFSALLSGVFVLLILTSCSDSDNQPTAQNPEETGCLNYAEFPPYSEVPFAGEAPWFNMARSVAIQDNRAYVAGNQYGLQIFDTSDPSQPVLLSAMPLPSNSRATEIAVFHNFAFVLGRKDNNGTLHVVEVSNSRSPKIVKSLNLPGGYEAIDLVYPHLFVGQDGSRISVFDIFRPSKTKLIGGINLEAPIEDIAVEDGYAFCLCTNSLQIVDVRNPASLRLVSSLEIDRWPSGIAVSGDLAVLTGDITRIIDISSVSQPRQIASLPLEGADVALIENRAMVFNRYRLVLTGINLSNPEAPFICSNLDLPPYPTSFYSDYSSIALDGDLAYLAASTYGLQIVDVSAPAQSVLLSHFACMKKATDVVYLNGYAYVIGSLDPMKIFKMTSARTWEFAGFGDLEPSADSVAEAGGWLYVHSLDGLSIFDVSDPVTPILTGTYDSGSSIMDWAVLDNRACLAYQNGDISFVDFSSPALPVALATATLETQPQSLALHGGHAFIAARDGGLQVVRYDPPGETAIVGSLDFDEEATGLTVAGNTLYVVAGSFYVVDISDPTAPVVVGSEEGYFSRREDLLYDNGMVYLLSYYSVVVFDVTDPANPSRLQALTHGGVATGGRGLAMGPEVILVARGTDHSVPRAGLGLMWRDCGDNIVTSPDKSLLPGNGF